MKRIYCFATLFFLMAVMTTLWGQSSSGDFTSYSDYLHWKVAYAESLFGRTDGLRREMVNIYTTNGYVRGDLDITSGEYDEGADPAGGGGYMQITFSWPDAPGTEWVMYKVDDFVADKTNEGLPSTSSTYTDPDGAVVAVWDDYHGVRIQQELKAMNLSAVRGANEQVRFKTKITPVDGVSHNVGCIVYFDTDLNGHDGAPISTSFGYFPGIAQIFYAPDVPNIWRAYELGYPPAPTDLQTLGLLTGFGATVPDVFWYGNWLVSVDNGWADADWVADIPLGIGWDSAAMVKWYQHNVSPGDTLEYVTYYGIGNLVGESVYIIHTPPDIVTDCDSIFPNPFSVQVILVNPGPVTVDTAVVSLTLPPGFDITSGDNPLLVGSVAGYGGSILASWEFEFDSTAYNDTAMYIITTTYRNTSTMDMDTVVDTFSIYIPPGPFSVELTADQTHICAGDSTQLHGSWTDGGGDYTFVWEPISSLSDPASPTPYAFPDSTTTYVFLVGDNVECAHIDSVTIIVDQPPSPAELISPADGVGPFTGNDTVLVWHRSVSGTEPIVYTLYVDGAVVAPNISDTSYSIPIVCGHTYDWYVVASNMCGDAVSDTFSFWTIPCGHPFAAVIEPLPNTYSSCADQLISIYLHDSVAVDAASIRLTVNSNRYDISDSRLAYANDTLSFVPFPFWSDGELVSFCLDSAANIYGVPLDSAVCSQFTVDLSPPGASNQTPSDGNMVLNSTPTISFDITDALSGLNNGSITLTVSGFGTYNISSPCVSWDGEHFALDADCAGIFFPQGDTIRLTIEADDSPDYCAPNHLTTSWWFWIEPLVQCDHQPNPFTPNGDDVNDVITFSYPFMFSKDAEIRIYNRRKELIFSAPAKPVSSYDDYNERFWNGFDKNGKPVPAGLYLYTIVEGNEVVCSGTITLLR